tara:strand:- start:214 stop:822 length:609 start_codon:yes stop_codon:yes gene_type:complete
MKILNLYSGIGGNRKYWNDHEVTAVETDEKIAAVYKSLYPNDTVLIQDAHEFLLHNHNDFDFIWSSPPCQSHSRMQLAGRNRKPRYPDMRLYEEIVYLRQFSNAYWIVENVKPYYGELIPATVIGRHYFWSNFSFTAQDVPRPKGFINQKQVGKQDLMDWLGIYYEGNVYYDGNHCPFQVLRNCVHPEIGRQILDCLEPLKI